MSAASAWASVRTSHVQQFTSAAMDEVPDLADEILREIRREYPDLPRVSNAAGEPMALIGIRHALVQFVESLTPGVTRSPVPPQVFHDFGKAEVARGRTLDSLQAIYRLGLRLALRRFAVIGQRVNIPPPAMYELADTGLEYLDQLVAQSLRGHAEAAARQADEEPLQLQRRIMKVLFSHQGGRVPDAVLADAARMHWKIPERVAVAVLLRPEMNSMAPAVGSDVLLDMDGEQPRIILADPETPGRTAALLGSLTGWSGAIGPSVPLTGAAKSLRWAEAAVRLIGRGLLPREQVLQCGDYAQELILFLEDELVDDLTLRRLRPLGKCSRVHGRRLEETLLAWLESRGGAPEIAARLGVHPQTVRYRLRQIRDLWGADLEDSDRRFELQLVLRARRLKAD